MVIWSDFIHIYYYPIELIVTSLLSALESVKEYVYSSHIYGRNKSVNKVSEESVSSGGL